MRLGEWRKNYQLNLQFVFGPESLYCSNTLETFSCMQATFSVTFAAFHVF